MYVFVAGGRACGRARGLSGRPLDPFGHPCNIIDELLCGTTRNTAVADFPAVRGLQKLVLGQGQAVGQARGDAFHDVVVLLAVRADVADGAAETRGKGQLLFHRVRTVDIAVVFHVVAVLPRLLDEVAAVGCRDNQHIRRARLHAALNDGFQKLVLHFVFLKRQIVDENHEAVVAVLDFCNHLR